MVTAAVLTLDIGRVPGAVAVAGSRATAPGTMVSTAATGGLESLVIPPSDIHGPAAAPPAARDPGTRPASMAAVGLAEYATLPAGRQRLVGLALALAQDSPWLPYFAGGEDPADGGFDCSGAIYYVLRKAGLNPPRSSGAQFAWLREHGCLHEVGADATDLRHVSLAALKPGDLLFWAASAASGKARVHHVAMYLGTETKDGRAVMINATDGRSYRGQQADGYGLSDFRLPEPESRSRLVGYGPPPGLAPD
jgi:cell wall-associated NlpC family hydrolase